MSTIAITGYAPRQSQVRLTRRGRLVVFLLSLVVVLAGALFLANAATGTAESEKTETIVVGTGESLWTIADERTDDSTASMIAHIKELNDLESSSLSAGQQLVVPAP